MKKTTEAVSAFAKYVPREETPGSRPAARRRRQEERLRRRAEYRLARRMTWTMRDVSFEMFFLDGAVSA